MRIELKALHKRLGTWRAVAQALGITERYLYMLRSGHKPSTYLRLEILREAKGGK